MLVNAPAFVEAWSKVCGQYLYCTVRGVQEQECAEECALLYELNMACLWSEKTLTRNCWRNMQAQMETHHDRNGQNAGIQEDENSDDADMETSSLFFPYHSLMVFLLCSTIVGSRPTPIPIVSALILKEPPLHNSHDH